MARGCPRNSLPLLSCLLVCKSTASIPFVQLFLIYPRPGQNWGGPELPHGVDPTPVGQTPHVGVGSGFPIPGICSESIKYILCQWGFGFPFSPLPKPTINLEGVAAQHHHGSLPTVWIPRDVDPAGTSCLWNAPEEPEGVPQGSNFGCQTPESQTVTPNTGRAGLGVVWG